MTKNVKNYKIAVKKSKKKYQVFNKFFKFIEEKELFAKRAEKKLCGIRNKFILRKINLRNNTRVLQSKKRLLCYLYRIQIPKKNKNYSSLFVTLNISKFDYCLMQYNRIYKNSLNRNICKYRKRKKRKKPFYRYSIKPYHIKQHKNFSLLYYMSHLIKKQKMRKLKAKRLLERKNLFKSIQINKEKKTIKRTWNIKLILKSTRNKKVKKNNKKKKKEIQNIIKKYVKI